MLKLKVRDQSSLLKYLLEVLKGQTRTRIKKNLAHGLVRVNGRVTTKFNEPLAPGDEIVLAGSGIAAASLFKPSFPIVYEDGSILVVDKPAGLLTIATDKIKT